MGAAMTPHDEWAEQEARQFDKIAEAIESNIEGWQKRGNHPDSLHSATVCAIKAETWKEAARLLRQPYAIAQERYKEQAA